MNSPDFRPKLRIQNHFLGLAVLVIVCGIGGYNWSFTPLNEAPSAKSTSAHVESPTDPATDAQVETSSKAQPDNALQADPSVPKFDRKQLVGTWRDSFFGTRTLTLNEDGTARMVLDLDFSGRLLYGRRLDFTMTWDMNDATISIDILDGTPANAAKSAMKTWGRRYEYVLDSVDHRTIKMRDWDGSAAYNLVRLTDESVSTPPN